MSKRKLLNSIKRKFLGALKEVKPDEDWKEKMRGELQRMVELNGQLILMMK